MNIEKIAEPILAENHEAQSKEIGRRIKLIQLEYANRISHEKGGDFFDVLIKELGLERDLRNEYSKRKGVRYEDKGLGKTIGEELAKLQEKIHGVYDSSDESSIYRVRDAIIGLYESWGPVSEEYGSKKEKGLITFEVHEAKKRDIFNEQERGEIGIDPIDKLVELHFETYFKYGETALTKDAYKKIIDGLRKVAIDIANNHRDARAVVGASWMLDKEALVKRIGFKYTSLVRKADNMSVWWQFVDQNGQINRQKLKEFEETGEFPEKSRGAYMMTEDFLKKYLPDEFRQKPIVLKRVRKEWSAKSEQISKEDMEFRSNWDSMGVADIRSALEKSALLAEMMEGAGLKNEIIDLFERMKATGKTFQEAREEFKAEMDDLGGKLRSYVDGKKYEETEVDLNDN